MYKASESLRLEILDQPSLDVCKLILNLYEILEEDLEQRVEKTQNSMLQQNSSSIQSKRACKSHDTTVCSSACIRKPIETAVKAILVHDIAPHKDEEETDVDIDVPFVSWMTKI